MHFAFSRNFAEKVRRLICKLEQCVFTKYILKKEAEEIHEILAERKVKKNITIISLLSRNFCFKNRMNCYNAFLVLWNTRAHLKKIS